MHKGVKCLDVSTGRVYISRDVVFDESVFPFKSLHPNAGALLRKEILLLPRNLQSFDHGGDNNCDNQYDSNHASSSLSLMPVQVLEENGAENGQNDQNLAGNDAILHVDGEEGAGAPYEDDSEAPGTPARPSALDHARSALNPTPNSGQRGRAVTTQSGAATSSRGGASARLRPTAPGPAGASVIGAGSSAQETSMDSSENSASPATSDATRSSASAHLELSAATHATSLEGSSGSSAASRNTQPPVQQQQVAPLRATTRLQKGIRNPKIRTDGTIPYGMLCISGEQTN